MAAQRAMPTSIYTALNREHREIRVLDVQPSGADLHPKGALHASLRVIRLPQERPSKPSGDPVDDVAVQAPPYATISYAWGDPTLRSVIYLDGTALCIPASAEDAVRRMRCADQVTTLWIDSICINQNDAEERAFYIRLMGDIYACSTGNLIWLGESDESTARAFRSFESIYRAICELTDDLRTWERTILTISLGSRAWFSCEHDLPAMLEVYAKPWFRRLWVLQEVTLAPINTCFCGDYTLPLLTILRPSIWLIHNRDSQIVMMAWPTAVAAYEMCTCIDPINGCLGRNRTWLYPEWWDPDDGGPDLGLAFTAFTTRFQVSVAHDRVFALLGLAPDSRWQRAASRRLDPDYTKPVSDLLRDATAAALCTSPSLEIFEKITHVDLDQVVQAGRATWMLPSLYGPGNEADTIALHCNMCPKLKTRRKVISDDDDPRKIKVLGAPVGYIASVGQRYPTFHDPGVLAVWLQSCVDLARNLKDQDLDIASESTPTVAVAATLVAGVLRQPNLETRPFCDEDRICFERMWSALCDADRNGSPISYSQPEDDLYAESLHRRCYDRRFFTTSEGRIGLGPESIRTGDLITVLYESTLPVALRPVEQHFLLAGSCYVHGLDVEDFADGAQDERFFDLM